MTTKRTEAVLAGFDRYKSTMDEAMTRCRELLAEDRYEEAQHVMAAVTQSLAKTSVNLRNLLIKQGQLPGENS